jgi:hypothetical protein
MPDEMASKIQHESLKEEHKNATTYPFDGCTAKELGF